MHHLCNVLYFRYLLSAAYLKDTKYSGNLVVKDETLNLDLDCIWDMLIQASSGDIDETYSTLLSIIKDADSHVRLCNTTMTGTNSKLYATLWRDTSLVNRFPRSVIVLLRFSAIEYMHKSKLLIYACTQADTSDEFVVESFMLQSQRRLYSRYCATNMTTGYFERVKGIDKEVLYFSPDVFAHIGNYSALFDLFYFFSLLKQNKLHVHIIMPPVEAMACKELIPEGIYVDSNITCWQTNNLPRSLLADATSEPYAYFKLIQYCSKNNDSANTMHSIDSIRYKKQFERNRALNSSTKKFTVFHIRDSLFKNDAGLAYADVRNANADNYIPLIKDLAQKNHKVRRLSARGKKINLENSKNFRDFYELPYGKRKNQKFFLTNTSLIIGTCSGISHCGSASETAEVLFLNCASLLTNVLRRPLHAIATKTLICKNNFLSVQQLGRLLQNDWANYLDVIDIQEMTPMQISQAFNEFQNLQLLPLSLLLETYGVERFIPDVLLTQSTYRMFNCLFEQLIKLK